MHDLRYALRSFRKRPAFVVAAVLTLAIATGANTAIFSVFYRVLLRPLPYREPERLVFVRNAWKNGSHTEVSIPDYLDRRNEAPAIEDAALIAPGTATLALTGSPEQLRSARVTPSFFTTLGRGAALGRVFDDGDDRAVVLTHATWQSRFGADPAVVGRTVRVNAEAHVVLGVLPADFELPLREVDVLLPFVFTPQQMSDEERGNEFSVMINRGDLSKPVSEERVYFNVQQVPQRAMGVVVKSRTDAAGLTMPLRAAVQSIDPDQAVFEVRTLDDRLSRTLQTRRTPAMLFVVFAAIALLLAAVGIYGVLSSSVAERVREFGIRQALGADLAAILRLVLRQGLATSVAGVAAGAIGSVVLGRYLRSLLFGVTAHDPAVLAGGCATLLAVAVLAIYIPARRATMVDPLVALRDM